jgi:hypothetical protein
MSCSSRGMTKKRIIALAAIVVGIAAIIYTVSLATKNFALLALSPLALGFLVCPLMCAVMGAGLWLAGRLSRNKEKAKFQKNSDGCCQHQYDNVPENHYTNSVNGKESINKSIDFETKINIDNNFNPPHPKSKSSTLRND